jgi:hypothetical protein
MQADEIAVLDQIFDRWRLSDLRRQTPGGIDGDFRVVADDIHAQAYRCIGNHRTDCAETDDTQRATGSSCPTNAFLPASTCLCRPRHRPPAADEAHRRGQVARTHQHAGDDQFLDRVGIGAGRVEHHHATLAHRLDRDVVGTGAGATDRQHAGGMSRLCISWERTRIASGRATSLPTV